MSARKFQKASIEELVHWYAEGSIAYEQALEAADSRSANRAQDKVTGAYRELRNRAATSLLLYRTGLLRHQIGCNQAACFDCISARRA
ncbi:hypothetical protein [Corallococcus sp. CA041A]|uniref:hypothetical protein n=1 Tax=Corallococcus sp. CA041A TaxID=2316727 RepID=UPI001F41B15E|nr:hypothetical protein [Corallococcus sp. CA041A]